MPYPTSRSNAGPGRFVDDGVGAMSQGKVLLALWDRLTADLERAQALLEAPFDQRRPPTGAEVSGTHTELCHAQRILEELQLVLEPDAFDGARELLDVYAHLHQQMVAANLAKDLDLVDDCLDLARALSSTWHHAHGRLCATATPTIVDVPAGHRQTRLAGTFTA